jgi:glycosyltransferase involved in cell wall biosynthesis
VSRHNALALGLPRAAVIPAAIDTEFLSPMDYAASREALGWEPTARYVVFPGFRSNVRKRFDLFSQAIDSLRRKGVDARAAPLENLSRQQVVQTLSAADALLMTSDWEGSPLALKEALSCGTPVVSVDVGDAIESLQGLPGCDIVARDPDLLGEALVRAFPAKGAPALRERAKSYDLPAIVDQILEVYREVLTRRPRRAARR